MSFHYFFQLMQSTEQPILAHRDDGLEVRWLLFTGYLSIKVNIWDKNDVHMQVAGVSQV